MRRGHEHDYEAVAVDYRPANGILAMTPAARTTIILWRCACKDACSTELAGRWTLAQVRGEPEPEPSAKVDLIPLDAKETRP